MDNNKNDVCCSNCKNKIDNDNTFCSYCGNVIVWDKDDKRVQNINNIEDENKLLINNCSSENDYVFEYKVSNNESRECIKKNNGMFCSKLSFAMYIIIFIYNLLCYLVFDLDITFFGIFTFIVSLLMFFFQSVIVLLWFVFGIVAIFKYYMDKNVKSNNRKIMNYLNILSFLLEFIL